MIRKKNGQVAVEFVVLLFFVAPIAINLMNYFNNSFLKPFITTVNNDMQCMVRYGYSCVTVGVIDNTSLANYEGEVPLDVQSSTHPLDMVKNAW